MTNTESLKLVNEALMSVVEMDDADTFDEQCDAIDVLKKIRAKLKSKEEIKC